MTSDWRWRRDSESRTDEDRAGGAAEPSGLPERCPVLGVDVSPVDPVGALRVIDGWIAEGRREYVCVSGVHGVMECQRDVELKGIHNRAGLVVPDGMPLVWVSRARGFGGTDRVYGPDLMLDVCAAGVERGWRHYLYGGAEGVPERLAEALSARLPGIRVVGTWSPPFRPLSDEEVPAVADRIDRTKPDIVWVGLSTPKQERWMNRFRPHLAAPVLVGVGAAFDFHAGLKPQAPQWMQRNGLEWLFRMLSEPRRLGPRYLKNNPAFVARILAEEMGIRMGPGAHDRRAAP